MGLRESLSTLNRAVLDCSFWSPGYFSANKSKLFYQWFNSFVVYKLHILFSPGEIEAVLRPWQCATGGPGSCRLSLASDWSAVPGPGLWLAAGLSLATPGHEAGVAEAGHQWRGISGVTQTGCQWPSLTRGDNTQWLTWPRIRDTRVSLHGDNTLSHASLVTQTRFTRV